MSRIDELSKTLDEQPSSKVFLELARLLIEQDKLRAKEVLIQGLYHYPKNLVARLLLAKLYYYQGWYNFSAREIAEAWSVSKSSTIEKLLLSFGEHGDRYLKIYSGQEISNKPESVLAEIDLDADFSDAIIEFDEE